MHLSFEHHCLENVTIQADVKVENCVCACVHVRVCVFIHMAPFPTFKALP